MANGMINVVCLPMFKMAAITAKTCIMVFVVVAYPF